MDIPVIPIEIMNAGKMPTSAKNMPMTNHIAQKMAHSAKMTPRKTRKQATVRGMMMMQNPQKNRFAFGSAQNASLTSSNGLKIHFPEKLTTFNHNLKNGTKSVISRLNKAGQELGHQFGFWAHYRRGPLLNLNN